MRVASAGFEKARSDVIAARNATETPETYAPDKITRKIAGKVSALAKKVIATKPQEGEFKSADDAVPMISGFPGGQGQKGANGPQTGPHDIDSQNGDEEGTNKGSDAQFASLYEQKRSSRALMSAVAECCKHEPESQRNKAPAASGRVFHGTGKGGKKDPTGKGKRRARGNQWGGRRDRRQEGAKRCGGQKSSGQGVDDGEGSTANADKIQTRGLDWTIFEGKERGSLSCSLSLG